MSFFQGTGCEIVKFLRTKLKKNKKMDAISALKTDTIQKNEVTLKYFKLRKCEAG